MVDLLLIGMKLTLLPRFYLVDYESSVLTGPSEKMRTVALMLIHLHVLTRSHIETYPIFTDRTHICTIR